MGGEAHSDMQAWMALCDRLVFNDRTVDELTREEILREVKIILVREYSLSKCLGSTLRTYDFPTSKITTCRSRWTCV